ncbi:hypothetical protein HRbin39_00440 [bacterium HR39]|nr:hypothetical protein HRbin39_00440 [bacterium HR39]
MSTGTPPTISTHLPSVRPNTRTFLPLMSSGVRTGSFFASRMVDP